MLLLSTALGERVTFRLSADIDPVQYPAQERKLAQGLKSLFRLLTLEGDVVASDGSFDARIDLGLTNAPEKPQPASASSVWTATGGFSPPPSEAKR